MQETERAPERKGKRQSLGNPFSQSAPSFSISEKRFWGQHEKVNSACKTCQHSSKMNYEDLFNKLETSPKSIGDLQQGLKKSPDRV